jgi:hypothetical protein
MVICKLNQHQANTTLSYILDKIVCVSKISKLDGTAPRTAGAAGKTMVYIVISKKTNIIL